jgi:nicotinate dehydrogenase subunit A
MPERFSLNVNGQTHVVEADDPNMPLLYALRDELGLSNPRFGCGLGQCGACTVHMDGVAVRSCQIPVSAAAAAKVTTLAGLGTPEKPHPLQAAWIEEQVSQCSYCINGWIMTGAALLAKNPHPTDEDIKRAFAPLICRCGTHGAALRAVKRAAEGA